MLHKLHRMNPGSIYAFFLLFLLSWTQMVLGDLHDSDTEAPPAGISGIYHDKTRKVIHVYYGHDLEEHMVHLLENHQKFPKDKNKQYPVPKKPSNKNRKKAMELSNLDPLPGTARDEKPPNFVSHNGKSLTVKRVSKEESDLEGHMLRLASGKARVKGRRGTKVMFHTNPRPDWTPPASLASTSGAGTSTSGAGTSTPGAGTSTSDAGTSTPGAGTSTSDANLCTREVVELYRRALTDGDHEQLEYLFRRQSCMLRRPKTTPKKKGMRSAVKGSTQSHRPASRPVGRSGPPSRPTSRRPAARRPEPRSAARLPAARHPGPRPAARPASASRPASRRPASRPSARLPVSRPAGRSASRPAARPAARLPASRPAGRSASRPASRRPATRSTANKPAAKLAPIQVKKHK